MEWLDWSKHKNRATSIRKSIYWLFGMLASLKIRQRSRIWVFVTCTNQMKTKIEKKNKKQKENEWNAPHRCITIFRTYAKRHEQRLTTIEKIYSGMEWNRNNSSKFRTWKDWDWSAVLMTHKYKHIFECHKLHFHFWQNSISMHGEIFSRTHYCVYSNTMLYVYAIQIFEE